MPLAGVPLRPGAVRGYEGLPRRGREAEALQTRPQHEEDEHDGREVSRLTVTVDYTTQLSLLSLFFPLGPVSPPSAQTICWSASEGEEEEASVFFIGISNL